IEYEARRQIGILEDGGQIDQETRLFDARKGETRSMRSKEEAHDYRYFPDPDLLPLELEEGWIGAIAQTLPELPDGKIVRFVKDYGLSSYDASVLSAERASADFFEQVAKGRDGKMAANWVINELFGRLNGEGKTIENTPVSASQLGEIVDLIQAQVISGKIAKEVFETVWTNGGSPKEIVKNQGLEQVTDTAAIERAVDQIIAANPDKAAQARAKPSMLGWFVGQVMKTTGGKANPQTVSQMLAKKLEIN
ncbi:MAG: Asp-tRNA(Asn)/Glu-tRNA(Gln) amidotransferase GatCAB subunit B, partial [Rhizobiales bacterium]|nr:Asp-tRNA(Asn)/Glu-tRNA(Gln) amidotransferase GatCAB subunit B [Hyphomicrobiales bacterium]